MKLPHQTSDSAKDVKKEKGMVESDDVLVLGWDVFISSLPWKSVDLEVGAVETTPCCKREVVSS